jgi:hypothetical protein
MRKRMRDVAEDISSGREDNAKSGGKMTDWEGANVDELYSSRRYPWWLQIIRDRV